MNRKRGITLVIAVVLTLCAIACCGYSCSKPTDKDFSGQTFTVTYDTMTENGAEIVTVQGGETIAEPFMPTRDGYIFGGWYLDESLTVACSVTTLSVTENITLYAKWIASTIKLETNFYEAGTVVGQEVTKNGKKYIRATATNNPGYTFVGWYEGSTKVDTTTSFVYDFELTSTETTYTATWIKCPITLEKTIDEGGSVAGLSHTMQTILNEEQQEEFGKKTTVTATVTATPNYGYEFKGWYNDGTLLSSSLSYEIVVFDSDKVTLTAKFVRTGETEEYQSENFFTVVYKAEGGTGDGSVTVRGGTKLKEPHTPIKSGYVFGGWYTDLNYAEANKWNFNNVVTSNVNLYAKWITTYATIETETNEGGTIVGSELTRSECSETNVKKMNTKYEPLYKKVLKKTDDVEFEVSYCDCNTFGVVLDSSGSTSNISNYSVYIPEETCSDFDLYSELFFALMENCDIINQTQILLKSSDEDKRYDNYSEFFLQAQKIFNSSNNAVSQNISYSIDNSALIGISYDTIIGTSDALYYTKVTNPTDSELNNYYEKEESNYVLTKDSKVNSNKTYYINHRRDEYLKSISSMFGYESVETFKQYAQKIADVYKGNSAQATAETVEERLKYSGAIYTANGVFVLPFAFKNNISNTVLAFVLVDTSGAISIFVSDYTEMTKATNLEKSNIIEIYGRCALFEKFKVTYCDCNTFGVVLGSSGSTSNISAHNPAYIPEATCNAFDFCSDLFNILMMNYNTTTTMQQVLKADSKSVEYKDFSEFFLQAQNIFNNSNSSVSQNISYSIESSALIGISNDIIIGTSDAVFNYYTKVTEPSDKEISSYYEIVDGKYILTEDKKVNENKSYYKNYSRDEHLKRIALLFGYENVDTFKQYATKIASFYKANQSKVNVTTPMERLMYDGAIYTVNKTFILPFAFKNALDKTVLALVIVDANGKIAVWFSDYAALANATNLSKSNSIEVYGRCQLFEKDFKATATPAVGYEFAGWWYSGSKLSSDRELVFEIKSTSYVVTAEFTKCTSHTPDANCICTKCGAEYHSSKVAPSGFCRHDNCLYFGSYPQSRVTDETIISALNSAAGAKPTSENNQGWTAYGYYGGTGNYMWYIDKTYNGEKYRGVYFTSYRPYYAIETCSDEKSVQDDNGYVVNTVYWFKFEPIKWRILTESGGVATILCEMIIDSQQYDFDGSFNNDYKESSIRKWLNETFYNAAFNSTQKSKIQTTTVDNGAASTNPNNNSTQWNGGANGFVCANTSDKIFLLSEKEVTNASYCFSSDYGICDTARMKRTTDYAQSQGAWTTESDGMGWWWLRSPHYSDEVSAYRVSREGYAFDGIAVYGTDSGVVPALRIKLS